MINRYFSKFSQGGIYFLSATKAFAQPKKKTTANKPPNNMTAK